MINAELARIRERLSQIRRARNDQIAASLAAARAALHDAAGTLHAGAPVFDTVSGLEGTVVRHTRETVVLPTPE